MLSTHTNKMHWSSCYYSPGYSSISVDKSKLGPFYLHIRSVVKMTAGMLYYRNNLESTNQEQLLTSFLNVSFA